MDLHKHGASRLDLDHHASVDVSVPHHLTKLLETDFPVIVLDNKSRHDVNYLNCFSLSNLIIENDRLVHYLLELGVFQVISYHHLQNLEQLAI